MENIVADGTALDADAIEQAQDEVNKRFEEAGIDTAWVIQSARDDLTVWDGYFSENMTRGRDDMNFVLRDQWTAIERSEFNRLFKPAMTFNRLYDTTKKVCGEQRKNRPDLMVRSKNGKASEDQIKLRADLVRTISYSSQADLVYQSAFRSALMMGYGAFEVCVDWEDPLSFNRIIKFDIVPDVTRVSFDPSAMEPHKGDGNFCARQLLYSKQEFEAAFPWVSNPVSYSDPRSLLDFQWQTKDVIVVCRYTKKEWFPLKLLMLSNGAAVTEAQWEEMQEQYARVRELADASQVVGDIIRKKIPEVTGERNTHDFRIRQYLMTQNEVIDFMEWPSRHLPVIFVDGDSNFIQGRQYTRSFVHEAKDAQKFVNYVGSEIAAEVKNRRREQWIGTPDNIQGYEQMWRNPELQNGILIAKPDPKTGQMPMKMQPWEISQSLLMQYQRGTQDIREIVGFSEQEQLAGRDMSGKARRERKMEGSMSAYVYMDNLNQAVAQGGRVVLDLLPHIVGDNERYFAVQKANGKDGSIILNQRDDEGNLSNVLEQGDFDVEIETGPSFAVQKEIALEFFQQTIANNPGVFPLIADLWAQNLDIEQMPQVVERLKTMVPEPVLAREEGRQPKPQPPSPQEQLMQMEMQDRQQQLIERAKELQIREQKHELEKVELAMKAQKLQQEMDTSRRKSAVELQKADMSYTADLARVMADLHKSSQPQNR